jgi:hypothetical protein
MPCSYVLWKVVARHLPTPQKRTAFCAAVGGTLLQQLTPDSLMSLRQAAAAAGGCAAIIGVCYLYCAATAGT